MRIKLHDFVVPIADKVNIRSARGLELKVRKGHLKAKRVEVANLVSNMEEIEISHEENGKWNLFMM